MPRPTICLNMIVKNESRVIRRCLDSVRPFIDAWCIVDTGSTDGTQQLIREALADLPGELFERPWKDFGHNRSEALELARGRADYSLIIDADEILIPEPSFRMPELSADAIMTEHIAGDSGTSFFLTQIVRSALPFRYVGVLHEVIHCDAPHTTDKLRGLACKGFFDSARNVDPKAKYAADARVLEAALEDEPDNARYVFYLAQSHRDAGDLGKAIAAYQRRAEMGGFAEEVWYSLFQIAVLLERTDADFAQVGAAYLAAYQARPTRAEPLTELARAHRQREQYALSYLFASAAAATPRPDDILFLDESVYAWRAADELGVASFYVGKPEQALAIADRLLASPALPAAERPRMEENRRFAVEALAGAKSAPTPQARKAKNEKKRKRRAR